MIYETILENKELIKLAYGLIASFICFLIVIKTDRLFKLSDHQGIRYFRNAFFFYGIAIIIRFVIGEFISILMKYKKYVPLTDFLFEFFIISASLFLLYSLIWKRIEKEKNYSSVINVRIIIFYFFALIFSIFDLLFLTNLFLYFSQIIIFLILIILSYNNYSKIKKNNFRLYLFWIMILGLLIWLMNFILEYFIDWNKPIQITMYIFNFLFLLFFIYTINKMINFKNG